MADPPRVVIGDPSPNHAEVLKEIEEVTLPHGGTDLAASFDEIDRVLGVSSIAQKEVVFLTDLQAASWQRPGESGDEGLKRARGQARGGSRGRSSSTWASRAARTARSPTWSSTPRSSPSGAVAADPRRRAQLRAEPGRRRPRPARSSTAGSGPSRRVDLPVGEDVAGRLQPHVQRPRRPPGRGPDRRRPAQARQPPLAGGAGPRIPERAAGRRPLQERAVPGRDRLPGAGAEPGGDVGGHRPR